ncbi:MAG: hypothetical protein IPM60_06885 [Rhodospirillales bacterium]|nr:hypothetical protein [Rhodospirillales bacterium]
MTTTTNSRTLLRVATAAALIMGVTGLAACSSTDGSPELRVARQPIPKQVGFHHTVSFAPNSATLSRTEQERLRAFVAALEPDYGDTLLVTTDATSPLGDRRARIIAAALRPAEIPIYQRAAADPAPGASTQSAGSVTVTLRRTMVELPACPDFSDGWTAVFNNQPHSNWSCATATNLGLMVANPADLARGRDLTPADGQRLAGSIKRYREGETKPLLGNAVSDINAIKSAKSGGGK